MSNLDTALQADNARQEFLVLRDGANSAHLATLATGATPEASFAPCVWLEGDYYLFLSELASHTGNLMRNSKISLTLVESEVAAGNPFARRRIHLLGNAQIVRRDNDRFEIVLAEFHRRFGKIMAVIEPLPDFHLFCVCAQRGRFIRGFGQTYELTGDKLDRLIPVDPRK